MDGGIPILTITISAGGRPAMPPGHEMSDGHPMEEHKDMMGEEAEMAPDKDMEKPRPMMGMRNLKPKARDSAPQARRL